MSEGSRFYGDKAEYYDLIYSDRDYEGEVEKIRKLIDKYKESDGKKLLDVGCGTGKDLKYLKEDFSCVGLDINSGMLEKARENVDGVSFVEADMVDFDLGDKFDVITCLFSSIGYVKTYFNLEKTFENFANHLKDGGVALVHAWFSPEKFKDGHLNMKTHSDEERKIARVSESRKKNGVSVIDMHFLVGKLGKGVKHFSEKHELGLFEEDRVLEIMEKVSLDAEFLEGEIDRGVYVGVKRG